MKYVVWLWRNSVGIRCNTAVHIISGVGQVALGLLMIWLSKRFIDETIRTGSADDVLTMVFYLCECQTDERPASAYLQQPVPQATL